MPYYPGNEEVRQTYHETTFWEHLVAQYAGLTMLQVQELNLEEYLMLKRDAFIERMNRTESGREYLENAARLECTTPDRSGLRQKLDRR